MPARNRLQRVALDPCIEWNLLREIGYNHFMQSKNRLNAINRLFAGAAAVDICPETPQFLYGYPHVPRYSSGIHDPIYASALFLDDGITRVLFIATDVIWLSRTLVAEIRSRISAATGIPPHNMMVTATHNHSAPHVVPSLSNAGDATVPAPDEKYLLQLVERATRAGCAAVENAVAAEWAYCMASSADIGTNRRDPAGPRDTDVPVLALRARGGGHWLALMSVCCMHPTVLHEDSTLISADFPGATRQYLQSHLMNADCPLIYHCGPCGNLSPRHVIRENTFAEAERLGRMLGESIAKALAKAQFATRVHLSVTHKTVDLPVRKFPTIAEAQRRLEAARSRHKDLLASGAAQANIRTAECDLFGAEELCTLARAATDGTFEQAAAACMPAEIQVIGINHHKFVAWPGEVFVEFGLELKRKAPDMQMITLANGELQGYLVTSDAIWENSYEACNAIFQSPESGNLLMRLTIAALQRSAQSHYLSC